MADLKSRYRNTWAGVLWVVINPLLMFAVHSLIFKHIMKIEISDYFVFLLGGLIPWIFISSTLNMTCHSFITYREVLLSFQLNPLLILASKVIDNFINFILPFVVLFIILSFRESFDIRGVLLLPLAMMPLLVGVYYLTLLMTTIQVYFRDTEYILSFMLSISYFLTPIFYPVEMVPESLRFYMNFNPFYLLIRPFQIALWKFDFGVFFTTLSESCLCVLIISTMALLVWKRGRNELYLHI